MSTVTVAGEDLGYVLGVPAAVFIYVLAVASLWFGAPVGFSMVLAFMAALFTYAITVTIGGAVYQTRNGAKEEQ